MGIFKRLLLIIAVWAVLVLIAIQVASNFLLAPILEREGTQILQVPVRVERAWIDVFSASVWLKNVRVGNLKGFRDKDFFYAERFSVDLDFINLLANEFVVHRIRLEQPVIHFENDTKGDLNAILMLEQVRKQLKVLFPTKIRLVNWITRYELKKFSIRNGIIKLRDQRYPEQVQSLDVSSFSMARIVFPPDPEEALPTAVYLNGVIPGLKSGKILALGRINLFSDKKSFDITGSLKDAPVTDYDYFFGPSLLHFSEGIFQLKTKALCHEGQMDIFNQVVIENPKLAEVKISKTSKDKPKSAFGLPKNLVASFFKDFEGKPFDFDFRVSGDLKDPKFNLTREIQKSVQRGIYDRISKRLEERAASMPGDENARQRAEETITKLKDALPAVLQQFANSKEK